MGGFFSMEQNARRNTGAGAVAPKLHANRSAVNVEVANTGTRRNNRNNRRNNSRRNHASSVASDPHELEEVVVTEPPAAPPNTRININRQPTNNGRINVIATNVQAPLPPNTTPEGEEQVGGRRRRSRRSKKGSKRTRRTRSK